MVVTALQALWQPPRLHHSTRTSRLARRRLRCNPRFRPTQPVPPLLQMATIHHRVVTSGTAQHLWLNQVSNISNKCRRNKYLSKWLRLRDSMFSSRLTCSSSSRHRCNTNSSNRCRSRFRLIHFQHGIRSISQISLSINML